MAERSEPSATSAARTNDRRDERRSHGRPPAHRRARPRAPAPGGRRPDAAAARRHGRVPAQRRSSRSPPRSHRSRRCRWATSRPSSATTPAPPPTSVSAASGPSLRRYRVRLPEGGGKLHLTYSGKFDFGLGTQTGGVPARLPRHGGHRLAGRASTSPATAIWYAQFAPERGRLVEFELTAARARRLAPGEPGQRQLARRSGMAHWSSDGALDEIYLVGGPLRALPPNGGRGIGTGSAMPPSMAEVFLRQDDAALAEKYLAATAQYLAMYARLIGPYPYGKFALVENFWETGFGMASFTLLGPQVIRMPFILTSSYPHEILHNWWGNSVFVDYASGNWCEGLTAYMADHLMQEQRGQGEAYRRDRLQDYASYVRHLSDGRDFPLTEFRSRAQRRHRGGRLRQDADGLPHAAPQAGRRSLPRLGGGASTARCAGARPSFADVRRTMEAVLGEGEGKNLGRFFRDWTERPGAAALAVEVGRSRRRRHRRRRLRGARDAPPDAGRRTVRARRAGGDPDRGRHGGREPASRVGRDAVRDPRAGAAAGAPRRSVVRSLPASRPARDPGVDRPGLRRAAPARGGRGERFAGRGRGVANAGARLADRGARRRGRDRRRARRERRAAGGSRGLAARPRQSPGGALFRRRDGGRSGGR